MCERYTPTTQKGVVEELRLAIEEPPEPSQWWRPRFNICPTQPAPVVPKRADRVVALELIAERHQARVLCRS